MRNGYRVLDTDSHQMEPPRIWADCIDPAFADRAPRIADMGNGRPGMCVEGEPITKQDGSYPMHSKEFLEAAARGMEKHEQSRAEGFAPAARLRHMDAHGVDAQVLYDYPHPDGTWPLGMADLEKQPLPETSVRKIFWDNAAPALGLA